MQADSAALGRAGGRVLGNMVVDAAAVASGIALINNSGRIAQGLTSLQVKVADTLAAAKLRLKQNATVTGDGNFVVDVLHPDDVRHILYGDGPNSGGHLWPGQPNKTPFPPSWSAAKIEHMVADVVTDPNTQWYIQYGTASGLTKKGKPGTWVAWETRDGVLMRVAIDPTTWRVKTAFPETQPIPPDTVARPIRRGRP